MAKVAYGIAIVALNIVNLTYVENKKVWNIDYDYIQNNVYEVSIHVII